MGAGTPRPGMLDSLQNLRKMLPSAEDESENCFPARSKEISSGLEPAQLWRAYSESGVTALDLRTHTERCLFRNLSEHH